MTTLIPWLSELKTLDRWLASRFSCFASTILEYSSNHPVILFEGSVFFERLSAHRDLVGPNSCCVVTTDNIAATATPFLISVLRPPYPNVVADSELDFSSCQGPIDAQRSAVLCMKEMCLSSKSRDDAFTFGVGKTLFSFLHDRCGRRRFQHFSDFRSLGKIHPNHFVVSALHSLTFLCCFIVPIINFLSWRHSSLSFSCKLL